MISRPRKRKQEHSVRKAREIDQKKDWARWVLKSLFNVSNKKRWMAPDKTWPGSRGLSRYHVTSTASRVKVRHSEGIQQWDKTVDIRRRQGEKGLWTNGG